MIILPAAAFTFLTALMLLALGVCFIAPVFAGDCYTDCLQASSCTSLSFGRDAAYCGDVEVTCMSRCSSEKAKESYGAIAYSKKDGSYGYSNGHESRKEAEKVAMKYCEKSGKSCKAQVWFQNSCGAVVTAQSKSFWGTGSETKVFWGVGRAKWYAQQNAMAACQKAGHKNCEAKVTHCSL